MAVATGPGSFTGLRIGVTTAKTFAYAVGCQAIGVHTLASIASRVAFGIRQFVVVLDAHRGELFVADFTRGAGDELSGSETTRVMRLEDWLPTLVPGCVVTGPGLIKVGDRLPEGVIALDPGLSLATAATVGQVGWRTFSAGRRESVFDLLPQYFRRTAAEEQWDRKQLG